MILRFLCCANTKNVDEGEELPERKPSKGNSRDEVVSPRFGGISNNVQPQTSKQQNQVSKEENNYTAVSFVSTKSDQIRKDAKPHSDILEDSKKMSYSANSRNAVPSRDKNSTSVSNRQATPKRSTEAAQDANNFSLMSIQIEDNYTENEKKFTYKSEDLWSLGSNQTRPDEVTPKSKNMAVLKGGVVMKKLDRSHENKSHGLSTENIFESRPRPQTKSGKREDLNSTPVMRSGTSSKLK